MISVVIPALNEEAAVGATVGEVRAALGPDAEIIVVDDGSTDRTGEVARSAGARVLRHPTNLGYGRALKDGIAAAAHPIIAIIDADQSYPADRLPDLVRKVRDEGYDMAVGQRSRGMARHGLTKILARACFRSLCQWAAGTRIPDVNSGLRVFRKAITEPFWDTFSTGYSFTTTLTMLSIMHGCSVAWVPIDYRARTGKSKVRLFRDSLRASQVLVEAILQYNPIKVFLLIAIFTFLAGVAGIVVGVQWWPPALGLGDLLVVASLLVITFGLGVTALRRRPKS